MIVVEFGEEQFVYSQFIVCILTGTVYINFTLLAEAFDRVRGEGLNVGGQEKRMQ